MFRICENKRAESLTIYRHFCGIHDIDVGLQLAKKKFYAFFKADSDKLIMSPSIKK